MRPALEILGETPNVQIKDCREQEEKYIYDFNPRYNILKYTLAPRGAPKAARRGCIFGQ